MRVFILSAVTFFSANALGESGYECRVVRGEETLFITPRFEITKNLLMEFDFDPSNPNIFAQCELNSQQSQFRCDVLKEMEPSQGRTVATGMIPVGAHELTISVGRLLLKCALEE